MSDRLGDRMQSQGGLVIVWPWPVRMADFWRVIGFEGATNEQKRAFMEQFRGNRYFSSMPSSLVRELYNAGYL